MENLPEKIKKRVDGGKRDEKASTDKMGDMGKTGGVSS